MKFAIHILLVGALAFAPWGCNRTDAPEESVSANAPQTEDAGDRDVAPSRQTTENTRGRLAPPPKPAPREDRREQPRPSARVDRAEPEPEREREPAPAPVRRARVMENVPAGTALTVTLADAISTETSQEGDRFTAHLAKALIVNGKVLADKGDTVAGHVKTVEEPGRVKGRARLELVLDNITVDDRKYDLDSEPFIVVASDNKERDAAIIAGGAGVGAVIGAVSGGKKGAALGAIIGGGSGTTAVLITKGEQLKLEPETRVNFVLSDDLDLPVLRNSTT